MQGTVTRTWHPGGPWVGVRRDAPEESRELTQHPTIVLGEIWIGQAFDDAPPRGGQDVLRPVIPELAGD
jgi:hypothetical protein